MGVEFDLATLIAFLIDLCQRTAVIAYIDSLVVRIVAKVVGIIAVIEGFQRGIRTSIKYSNASILGICDVQPIVFTRLPAFVSITSTVLLPSAETNRRPPFTSADRWSIRPCTSGNSTVFSSRKGCLACPHADATNRNRTM